ncbi:pyruvate/2-oxoglutarate dehydrogenase complex, dehydrogenase component beta subunit [Burkholderiales bacterium JOSHI_001]|nr:pyruvate/2-oxoglutarate dehydrogenase complex, dehydrogenase component beta subunit [Burkholderiales bacterium JOSHI_001]
MTHTHFPHSLPEVPGFARDRQGKPVIGLDNASLYAWGHLLRSTEQLILDLFGRGLLSGTTHTCLGQELCQLAVVRALDHADDVVLSNHRNHGHFLTYSGHFVGLVAEIMGREAGVCRGYGGSQHIAYRHFHSNGVQAGMTAIGTGLALQRRRDHSPALVAIMIGDGTLGEGLLYESMNLASIWRARVLFVVENNGIAQTTETRHTLGGSIAARGQAFGLNTWQLDDADPEFAARVQDVVRQMRDGDGPGMLIVDTGRLGPHSKGDDLRPAAERDRIAARDPLAALGRRLPESERVAIEARNQAFIGTVEAAAMASPESRFDEVPWHCLRPAQPGSAVPAQPASAANVRAAINAGLRSLLEHAPATVLLGEDLHEPYGGAFKVTAGLSEAFSGRVISTPISEAGITGASIGLALAGQRPLVEIMFADFVSLSMDQLYNHAVKFPGMFPDCAVPMVLRTPCGGRRGYGPTHSQSVENLLVSVPGLTVLYGSHRHNVGQLLVDASARWPNPTVFLEHKLLYGEAQDPGDYVTLPPDPDDLGAALFPTLRGGDADADLAIVSFGGMLPVAERAAQRLRDEEELAVQLIAPSLLSPLPRQTLLAALMQVPRILVVEESHHEHGVGAELLASLAEAGYTGSTLRVGMPPVPIAAARSLEAAQLPDENSVVAAALALV